MSINAVALAVLAVCVWLVVVAVRRGLVPLTHPRPNGAAATPKRIENQRLRLVRNA